MGNSSYLSEDISAEGLCMDAGRFFSMLPYTRPFGVC
jgi:hypothetical protein